MCIALQVAPLFRCPTEMGGVAAYLLPSLMHSMLEIKCKRPVMTGCLALHKHHLL